MTLHVINKTDATLWQLLLAALAPEDGLLLIEDAVYTALPNQPQTAGLLAHCPGLRCHGLADHLAARGISAKIRPEFIPVTYHDFVAMSLLHQRVVNWH